MACVRVSVTSMCDALCARTHSSEKDPCKHAFFTLYLEAECDGDRHIRCPHCGCFYETVSFGKSERSDNAESLSLCLSEDLEISLASDEQCRCYGCQRHCGSVRVDPRWMLGRVFCTNCINERCDEPESLSCVHCGIFYKKLEHPSSSPSILSTFNQLENNTQENVFSIGPLMENIEPSSLVLDLVRPKLTGCSDMTAITDESGFAIEYCISNFPALQQLCDSPECTNQTAVGFCEHCEYSLCVIHQQSHETIFRDRHTVILIEEAVKLFPDRFIKPKCRYHSNKVLLEACRICDKMICTQCDSALGGCTGQSSRLHDYKNFDELKEEVESFYNHLSTLASEKAKELQEMESNAQTIQECEEKRFQDRLDGIAAIRRKQIELIESECQRATSIILQRREKTAKDITNYTSNLNVLQQKLEKRLGEIQQLNRHHISERILQKKKLQQKVAQSAEVFVDKFDIEAELAITTQVNPLQIQVNVARIPNSLSLESSHDIRDNMCLSVDHRDDGSLLVGTLSGLKRLCKDKKLTKYENLGSSMTLAAVYKERVYIRRDMAVDQCSTDMTSFVRLLQYNNRLASITFSEKYIGLLRHHSYLQRPDLILYEFSTKRERKIQTNYAMSRICLLPDGHVVAAFENDELGMFTIEEDKLLKVWSRSGIAKECCIRSSADGLIYVCCFPKRIVHIISPENGETLRELYNENIPADSLGSVSLKGDQLAVPGWTDGKVYLFSIR